MENIRGDEAAGRFIAITACPAAFRNAKNGVAREKLVGRVENAAKNVAC